MIPAPRLPASLSASLSAGSALVPEARELLANPSWEEAGTRILITRLSPWRDASRSSSHLVLFSETRRALPGAYIDFAFLPDRADRERLARAERERGSRLPWFYGIASLEPPSAFDLVFVSNAFGLELVNLASLFAMAGLPLRSSVRRASENLPLVVIGGSNASALGPIVAADGDSMVDGIFFGEGEGAIGRLAAVLTERGLPPESRLERAMAIEGFWAAGKPGASVRPRRLPAAQPPLTDPPLLNSEESSTARLQISSGCPGLCSFCFEGWDRRPYRELPFASVLSAARKLKLSTGADSLEVYSFNFNTHEEIAALIFELGRIFRRVNLMSQRLDILAGTQGLLAAELAADKRSFTLGLEGISARMRAYYRKGLSEGDIERLEGLLLVPGIKELKLFYIVSGLETGEDLREFASFMSRLSAGREERAKGLRILASAGYLVRLPRTPLQHAPLALDEKVLAGIVSAMEGACRSADIEFRLAVHFDEYCADQLLSLGDGRLLPWLERAADAGFVYDGSLGKGVWPSLKAAAEAQGLLDQGFLAEKDSSFRPPLPFLECDSKVLHREYLAARDCRDRIPCLGAAGGSGCSGCGACPDPGAVSFITTHRIKEADPGLVGRIARLTAAKAAFQPLYVAVDLSASLSGSTASYKGAWLARRLMALPSGMGTNADLSLFEAREALFCPSGLLGLPEGFTGKTVFALFGPSRERLAGLAAALGLEVRASLPRISKASVELELPLPAQDAIDAFRSWLAGERVAVTERKLGETRVFSVAARDARKAIVLEAEFLPQAEPGTRASCRARLSLGSKARLSDWLCLLPDRGLGVSVRVAAFFEEEEARKG